MVNVFMEKSAKEMSVKLSDGRIMPLENHVKDLKKDNSKKELTSEAKDEKVNTKELKVGEWFLIDRNVINENKEKIHSKCIEIRGAGEDLWERFKKSDKIASQNPDQYPRVMEVYIFTFDGEAKTEQEMQEMCEKVGDGMCDEIICDFELQMRICNGEPVHDLLQKADKIPYRRFIRLRDGGTGHFGGGNDYQFNCATILEADLFPDQGHTFVLPYAFREVLFQ